MKIVVYVIFQFRCHHRKLVAHLQNIQKRRDDLCDVIISHLLSMCTCSERFTFAQLVDFEILHYIASNRKVKLSSQASSEQADTQSKPQVSIQMLSINFHAWAYLSIVMLECTLPAKRFPPKTVNEKKFLSTQSLIFILTKNQSDYSMVL